MKVSTILANALSDAQYKISNSEYGQDNVKNIIQWGIAAAGLVAVIFIVYAGFQYTTSNGDAAKTKKALQTIIYAVAGLLIVIAAEAITFFVFNNAK